MSSKVKVDTRDLPPPLPKSDSEYMDGHQSAKRKIVKRGDPMLILCHFTVKIPGSRILKQAYQTSAWFGESAEVVEYTVGVTFGSTAVTQLISYAASSDRAKSTYYALSFYICLVSCLNSQFIVNDRSAVVSGRFVNGVTLDVPISRYLMWFFTTPAMIELVYCTSNLPRSRYMVALAADMMMLVTGFLWEWIVNPYLGMLFLLLSWLAYIMLLMMMFEFINGAVSNLDALTVHAPEDGVLDTEAKSTKQILHLIKWLSVATWSIFPMIMHILVYMPGDVGTDGTAEVLLTLCHYGSKVLYVSLICNDIRVSQELRKIIRGKRRELLAERELTDKMAELVKQKETFLSATSHELRTPLHGIIGLTVGLLNGSCGELNPEMERTLRTVEVSGGRLLSLINDILDSASLKNNNSIAIKHMRVALYPIIEQAMTLISPLIKEGVSMVLDVSEEVPDALGDEDRIIQVMNNLLGNAVKFTEMGQICVRACVLQDPSDAGKEPMVQVEVSDTGIGILEAAQQKIFAPFSQADEVTTRKFGGTGLGLWLAYSLVETHGGKLTVESKEGIGSTFRFTLPVRNHMLTPNR